jgi:DNA-binding CsgD family transcriptional regulator
MDVAAFQRRSLKGEEDLTRAQSWHAFASLRQRSVPKFVIVNHEGEVEFSSPSIVDDELLLRSKHLLADLRHSSEAVEPVYFDDGMMLRVVPLLGAREGYCAVFIEERSRNSLAGAGEHFGLTRRERDVLAFILKGYSNGRIAGSLFISESTVGDHVKSIFRKTETKSRSELVVRVLDRGATTT